MLFMVSNEIIYNEDDFFGVIRYRNLIIEVEYEILIIRCNLWPYCIMIICLTYRHGFSKCCLIDINCHLYHIKLAVSYVPKVIMPFS